MDRLNYNQLYYFYIVATEGSIKAACERLHLTQPTISGQLKTLEEDLGYQLFDRKYRKLVLNQKGKEILVKAEKIFVLGDELLASLPNQQTKYRTEIRIGVTQSLPNTLVHDFTVGIWADETMSGQIVHGDMPDLMKYLSEDKIDLILTDTPHGQSKKYKSINLGSQNLVAVASSKFKAAKKDFPESLSGLPYISFDKSGQVQEEIDFFFKINNISPELIGSVDDDTFLRMVAAKGICFSILPELSVKEMLRDKSLIKLGDMTEVVSNRWVVVTTPGSKRVPIRKLINKYLVKKKNGRSGT